MSQQAPTKVMGRRLVAGIIDYLLLPGVALFGVFFLTAEFVAVDFCTTATADNCLDFGDGETYYLFEPAENPLPSYGAGFVVWALNVVLLQGLTAASLGKLMFGLRVVDAQGAKASFAKVAGRSALWIVDGVPCCIPLVGPIVALSSSDNRRLGDKAAGTYVVHTQSLGVSPTAVVAGAPGMGVGFSPQPGVDPTQPHWDDQRDMWVQWDSAGHRWMRFDDDAQDWEPLS